MNEESKWPEIRELDGVYFRVNRDGKWCNICFTDLTKEEQKKVVEGREPGWLVSLCFRLAEVVREIGDACDIRIG